MIDASEQYDIGAPRCGVGGLVTVAMSLVMMPLQSAADTVKGQPDSVCPGFVVLANGYAVLSEANDAMQANTGHGHGSHQMDKMANTGHGGHHQADKMANTGHGHGGHQDRATVSHQHLMGYRHGQAIVAGKDGLCVPLSGLGDTAWMAVSREASLSVAVASMRGALAHNSRANEGFDITVVQPDGKPLENIDVQLLARMPHHDHRMPGGHGPANDPDVKGLVVQPDDQGRYRVSTVDFSMPGPWLLEVVVKNGDETHKAYFAPHVGEE